MSPNTPTVRSVTMQQTILALEEDYRQAPSLIGAMMLADAYEEVGDHRCEQLRVSVQQLQSALRETGGAVTVNHVLNRASQLANGETITDTHEAETGLNTVVTFARIAERIYCSIKSRLNMTLVDSDDPTVRSRFMQASGQFPTTSNIELIVP